MGGHPFALNALYIEYNALAYYGLLIDVGFYHPIASTPLQQWSLHHFQCIQNNARVRVFALFDQLLAISIQNGCIHECSIPCLVIRLQAGPI